MIRRAPTMHLALCLAVSTACSVAFAESPRGAASFEYDVLGNVRLERNGLQNATTHTYDALSRRKRSTDANAKDTLFDYDLRDQLIKVTDARNVVTQYVVDGLGKLSQTISADTGTATTVYDEAGNLKSRTDAKQQTTTFDYDALNRVTLITYADASTVAYTYDQGDNAVGRLSLITDSSGSTRFDYDTFGRVSQEARTIGGVAYTTSYHYDAFGRPLGLTYPSGRRIEYGYDALGRVSSITSKLGSTVKPVLSAVTYEPFGPVKSVTFGNGQTQLRSHDLDGRLDSYSLSNSTMALGYDGANRITKIGDAAVLTNATTYDYDKLDRLTSAVSPSLSQGFTYDDVGNRTSRSLNGSTSPLSYAPTSNKLTAVGVQSIQMDANGSIINRGDGVFAYDARGRLTSFNGSTGLIKYTINALGQRVRKVTPTSSTVFHYDGTGKLIAETTTEGGSVKTTEYVYLGDMPVAVLK